MNFQEQLNTTVRTDKRTREHLRKSVKGREEMYLDLMKILQQNGENADDKSTNSSISTSITNTVTEKRKHRRVA